MTLSLRSTLLGLSAPIVLSLLAAAPAAHATMIGDTVTCSAVGATCSTATKTVNGSEDFTIDVNGQTTEIDVTFTGTQLEIEFLDIGDGKPTTGETLPSGLSLSFTDINHPFVNKPSQLTELPGSEPTGFNGASVNNLTGVLTVDLSTDHVTNDDVLTYNVATAPEPGSLALLGTGLAAGAGFFRRRLASAMGR